MPRQLTTMLTIAGSDCTGGAGIQADIRAAAACSVYAMSAVTAVTAQNSAGVSVVATIEPDILESQLKSLSEEITPDAVKIGMVGSPDNCRVIASYLESLPHGVPVVIDPVLASSSGGGLAADTCAVKNAIIDILSPLATVVTPNLNEAADILGLRAHHISIEETDEIALRLLDRLCSANVVLKGGHLAGDTLVDILVSDKHRTSPLKLESQRIECVNLHGTGCTYSSILTAELAKGNTVETAFITAGTLMHEIIVRSTHYRFGTSAYGPLNTLDFMLK